GSCRSQIRSSVRRPDYCNQPRPRAAELGNSVLDLGVSFHFCNVEALVSPILVRPVREQLEHDRIIRLLQSKWRRKYEAGINPGSEQNTAVGTGPTALYPHPFPPPHHPRPPPPAL